MSDDADIYIHRRSDERLRYSVDVAQKAVNDAFKIFSVGKRVYHQLFSDVCQDISAQLDTLNLLIKPLLEVAPLYDFEPGVEGNGIRSLLGIVDSVLKELITHLKYCSQKHTSFFFNGTNVTAKLVRFCAMLSRLGKLLDIASLVHQQLGGSSVFLELSNPVGALCMREFEGVSRECFYGQLVGTHFNPAIRNIMKAICVALSSYGIGYYSEPPASLSLPQSLIWKGSASIYSGAKYWFKEEERSRKFVELTHKCATIDFTKSFWNLVDNGPLAEVPKMVNKTVEVAVEIFIEGEPLYVKNKNGRMILMHPPIGTNGSAGVTVGFLSSKYREGQIAAPVAVEGVPLPPRSPKSKRLLLHFHGGGFVSGSHVQHETYLRRWCADLDTVVVSVNYSLAPEHPFPKGLDDCIFAYAWCLENLHTLGCTGKSIVFMGDSAGGNLAITTAMRANSYGLRPPDGILAAYPVTYVKYSVSVSRLMSSLDILLPSGVLQCCLRAYSGVPVDSNEGFYEWLQTADSQLADEETPEQREQTITELNSSYINDISSSVAGYKPSTTPDIHSAPTPDTSPEEIPTSEHEREDQSLQDSDSEIDLETEAGSRDQRVVGGLVRPANSSQASDDTTDQALDIDTIHISSFHEQSYLDTIRLNPVVFDKSTDETKSVVLSDVDKIELVDQGSLKMDNYGVENSDMMNITEAKVNNIVQTDVLAREKLAETDPAIERRTSESSAEMTDSEPTVSQDITSPDIAIEDSGIVAEQETAPEAADHASCEDISASDHGCDKSDENQEPIEISGSGPSNGHNEDDIIDEEGLDEQEKDSGLPVDGNSVGSQGHNGVSETGSLYSGGSSGASGIAVHVTSAEDDLERMLYEETETRFKGTKLVLTPDRSQDSGKRGPPSPSPSPLLPFTNPLKAATVIKDEEHYPYPEYVINPGEIATRRNATLLQRYFHDPFMSPYLADAETLSSLPPIHVVAAEYDPLLDDSVGFCKRVREAGGKVSLEIVPGMTHGFLNLVVSSKACEEASKCCYRGVDRLFKGSEESELAKSSKPLI